MRREPDPDNPEIRADMREIGGERRRFGYRRIGLMLEREGTRMNHKTLRRLYRDEELAVKRRRGRKWATGTRAPQDALRCAGERWSLDFVSDMFEPERWLRTPVTVDDGTRECVPLAADASLSGQRVAGDLDKLIRLRRTRAVIFSDIGTDPAGRACQPIDDALCSTRALPMNEGAKGRRSESL